ncbi:uncharacterized protein LOC134834402 [Culicoides brevitarsis]|uniref:uncharacterized protein LOC134834402 n=1 Tax=Culicoides brevitarsis TaxID=469753 RepID=UPI00307B4B48
MASLNQTVSTTSKPKIDLLLKEINEVKHREKEYLIHIKSLYHDKKNIPIPLDSKNDGFSTQDDIKNLSNTVDLSSNSNESDKPTKVVKNKSGFINCPMKKGIMHQFYTSRGKLQRYQQSNIDILSTDEKKTIISKIERDSLGKPVRKGYRPVEEKIQQELMDLQNRELELKLSRIKMNSNEVKNLKHLGLNQTDLSLCKNNSGPSGGRGLSLVERDLHDSSKVTTSHELIEKWEYLIQERKQKNLGYLG